jgi:hypothetical protein
MGEILLQRRTDRIIKVTDTGDENFDIVTVMDSLPLARINYGATPAKAENPNPSPVLRGELTRLDLRGIGDSHMIVGLQGKDVDVKLNTYGVGSFETVAGEEYVVFADGAVEDARASHVPNVSNGVFSGHATRRLDLPITRTKLAESQDFVHRGHSNGGTENKLEKPGKLKTLLERLKPAQRARINK